MCAHLFMCKCVCARVCTVYTCLTCVCVYACDTCVLCKYGYVHASIMCVYKIQAVMLVTSQLVCTI